MVSLVCSYWHCCYWQVGGCW